MVIVHTLEPPNSGTEVQVKYIENKWYIPHLILNLGSSPSLNWTQQLTSKDGWGGGEGVRGKDVNWEGFRGRMGGRYEGQRWLAYA